MRYYPIHLNIRNQTCLVVGGGDVGNRKVVTLLDCGARVSVVSPKVTAHLEELASSGKINLIRRAYRSSDLNGAFIVIGATDDEALNLKIYSDAKRQSVLCNIADHPEVCNFILPSVVNRGDLVITVSTSGKSPAFAKHLRKELEKQFNEAHADFLQLMGAIRKKLLRSPSQSDIHRRRFEEMIKRGCIDLISKRDKTGINRLLFEIFGDGYEYDQLMKMDS